jgi:hypothetical protein
MSRQHRRQMCEQQGKLLDRGEARDDAQRQARASLEGRMRAQSFDQRLECAEQAITALAPVPVVAAGAADFRSGGTGVSRAGVGDSVERLVPGRQAGRLESVAHPSGNRVNPIVIGEGTRVSALHGHVRDRGARAMRPGGSQRSGQRSVREQPKRPFRHGLRQLGRVRNANSFGIGRQSEILPEGGARMHQQACGHADPGQGAAEEGGIYLAAAEVRLEIDLDQLHRSAGGRFMAATNRPHMNANRPSRQPDRWPSSRQRNV